MWTKLCRSCITMTDDTSTDQTPVQSICYDRVKDDASIIIPMLYLTAGLKLNGIVLTIKYTYPLHRPQIQHNF